MTPGDIDFLAHAPHGGFEADEQRLAHYEVADIEFAHFRDGRDGADGVVGETVADMDFDALSCL